MSDGEHTPEGSLSGTPALPEEEHGSIEAPGQGGPGELPGAGIPHCGEWSGRRVAAVALGATALGALGVWLYLRLSSSPQDRAAHRIEELQHRLKQLADDIARHAPADAESAGTSTGS